MKQNTVMAGLDPVLHAFPPCARPQVVDPRAKPGDDVVRGEWPDSQKNTVMAGLGPAIHDVPPRQRRPE
ncbi:hypothetical protein [Ancylobacter sp. SL191]|uniref:hypothetical protein n=1 Tax=Ancylobacter sp. SL191 TaxID=2995166 RepID=UPI002271610C|nr:hypothetical protein [Ancylobacter sp. SL191]WAC28650.1 hypothetical protein OU996_06270 [Ancylobacter sp. SL191]